MCCRYCVDTEEDVIEMREIIIEINRRYLTSIQELKMKTGEIFPTDVAPILMAGGAGTEPRPMAWGFPKWQGSGVIVNARSETAGEKPLFRNAFERRRCIVPSTGFFEWKHENGKAKKNKYLLRLPGEKMLYMAGFYDTFRDKAGKPYEAFVILTAAANDSIAPLHDRMPVILPAAQKERWLLDFRAAREILERQKDIEFQITQVSA